MRTLTLTHKVMLLAIIGAIVTGGVMRLYYTEKDRRHVVETVAVASERPEYVTVHISGAVENPGVYSFREGTITEEAINAAGGFRQGARKDTLNLAEKVADGEKIFVPMLEFKAPAGNNEAESESDIKININTATAEELERVPGLGPALSSRIVELRRTRGPYTRLEELKLVSGIGDWRFDNIRDYLSIE